MKRSTTTLTTLLLSLLANAAFAQPLAPNKARPSTSLNDQMDDQHALPKKNIPKKDVFEKEFPAIRASRPASISASFVGRTPYAGVLVDMNLLPFVGLGAGFGYFSSGAVSGNFIPVTLLFYPLKTNLSPFVTAGVDFVTVKFESKNTLLNSTFKGTQLIVGGGLEYRFDFGLLLRVDAVRFINAKVWSPGGQVGYSFVVD